MNRHLGLNQNWNRFVTVVCGLCGLQIITVLGTDLGFLCVPKSCGVALHICCSK